MTFARFAPARPSHAAILGYPLCALLSCDPAFAILGYPLRASLSCDPPFAILGYPLRASLSCDSASEIRVLWAADQI